MSSVGILVGLHVAIALAGLVSFPGSAPIDGVISWLTLPGSASIKSKEFAGFVFSVLLAPLVAWCFARATIRATQRDPEVGSWLVPLALALGVATLLGTGLLSDDASRATLVSSFTLCVASASIFALVWHRERISAALAARRCVLASRPEIPAGLLACVPLTVFLLVLGPPVAHDHSPYLIGSRVATVFVGVVAAWIGANIALANGGRSSDVAPGRGSLLVSTTCVALTFLLLARFSPQDPYSIGIAVALALTGLLCGRLGSARAPFVGPGSDTNWRLVDNVLFPALVIALIFHPGVDGDIDFFHEGEFLTPAFEVWNGETPFVDVYLQHGLGRNVLRTLATFEWIDVTLEAERASRTFFIACTHAAAYLLLLAAFRSRWTALLVALMMATPQLALDWRFLFPLLAFAALARDIHAPKPRLAAIAGVCCGIAFFVSTDLGVYSIIAAMLFLVIDEAPANPFATRAMRVIRFAVGVALGAMPFLIALHAWGALPAFIDNLRSQITLQLSVWGLPMPSLADVLSGRERLPTGEFSRVVDSPTLCAIAAVGLYLAIPTFRAIAGFSRTATPTTRALTLLAIAGLITFRTALGRSDIGHLRFASVYGWLLAAGLALSALRDARLRSLPASLRTLARLAPATLLIVYTCSAHVPLYTLVNQWTRLSAPPPSRGLETRLAVPALPHLGDVVLPVEQARGLSTLDALLAEELSPSETFYDFSNAGALYALLGRRAPTRYFMPVYAATPEMQDQVIADLEREKPPLAFSSTRLVDASIDGFSPRDRAPRLAAYLSRIYDEPRFVGIGYLAKRKLPSTARSPSPAEDPGERK